MLLYKKMDPMEGFAVGEPINVTIAVFNKGAREAAQSNPERWRTPRLHPPTRHPPTLMPTLFSWSGLGNAYSLVVSDDNWKSDKFQIISGGNNFTLDYLNAGDQYVHDFVVVPIKKTWHRIKPAKMAFIDGVEGESTSKWTTQPPLALLALPPPACPRLPAGRCLGSPFLTMPRLCFCSCAVMHLSNTLPDIRIAATKASKWEAELLSIGAMLTLNVIQTKQGWITAGGIVLLLLFVQLVLVAKAVLQKRRHLRALEDVKKM